MDLNLERVRRIISDWAVFHGFEDDCGYPLVSPSDVVLDDLAWRLTTTGPSTNDVRQEAERRWANLPPSKGKARYLRRPGAGSAEARAEAAEAEVKRLAAEVRDEREACAQVAEAEGRRFESLEHFCNAATGAASIAAAIRARGTP